MDTRTLILGRNEDNLPEVINVVGNRLLVNAASDDLLEVTLSLDVAIYAPGDVLAATQEIPNAFRVSGGQAILQSIVLLDEDDQAGALDLVFLRSDTSIGAENSALNISDAAAEEIITVVPFTSGDYVDLTNSQIAMKATGDYGMGVLLEPTSHTSLYIAAISRDTKTYTASGIVLKIGLLRS